MYTELRSDTPIAKKDYGCDAFVWLDQDLQYYREEMTAEDEAILDKAISEGCKIRKGDKYMYSVGLYEGEFSTFRGRIDLTALCHKYDAFQD